MVCNSDLRDAPLSGLGEFWPSTIPSSSSIRSSIRHILRPLLLPCWVDGPCCSSLMPALARVATFRTHPSKAPPMFSRPVDALDGTVDVESKEVVRGFSGGCAGVRFGMCCAKNRVNPSNAGPGPVEVGSRVPTPVADRWILLRWRRC